VYLLDKLSKINDFTLNKVEPARIDGDKMPYEKPLVEEGFQNSGKSLTVRAPTDSLSVPSTDVLLQIDYLKTFSSSFEKRRQSLICC